MQGFLDTESDPYKTSFSVFVAILYLKILYILVMTLWGVEKAVIVPSGVVSNLKNYHLVGIRYLYDCYREKLKGAILNHEIDMNFHAQVSAFLTALEKQISSCLPTLIICSENNIIKWLYHLKLFGSFKINYSNESTTNDRIIVTTFQQKKFLQSLIEKSFSFIIIEEIDLVCNKRILKQLKGDFHVGLTSHNFMREPKQKLFFNVVNWANPGVLGKFNEFCKDDNNHRQNFRWPYDKYLNFLTWNFCEKFVKPTEAEKKDYAHKIKIWALQEKITVASTKNVKIRKRKFVPDRIEDEGENISCNSSDSSQDCVESLGKKINIRKRKKKVSLDHKNKNGKFVKNEGNIEKKLNEYNSKIDFTLPEKNYTVCDNDSKFDNGDKESPSKSPKGDQESPNGDKESPQKLKRKKCLPLLNFSSDEENSVEEESADKCVGKISSGTLDICTMLEQSVEDFEKSLEKPNNDENNDILMSIVSKKLNEEIFSESIYKNDSKIDNFCLSDNSDDSEYFKSLTSKIVVKKESKEQMLSLLFDKEEHSSF